MVDKFLGVGVGAGSNCCKDLRTTCKAFVKMKRQGIENVLYSMLHLSQVKISSNQYKGKERREKKKEKKQKTKEAAMANALIIWSLILCYYLFDSLSKIKWQRSWNVRMRQNKRLFVSGIISDTRGASHKTNLLIDRALLWMMDKCNSQLLVYFFLY